MSSDHKSGMLAPQGVVAIREHTDDKSDGSGGSEKEVKADTADA